MLYNSVYIPYPLYGIKIKCLRSFYLHSSLWLPELIQALHVDREMYDSFQLKKKKSLSESFAGRVKYIAMNWLHLKMLQIYIFKYDTSAHVQKPTSSDGDCRVCARVVQNVVVKTETNSFRYCLITSCPCTCITHMYVYTYILYVQVCLPSYCVRNAIFSFNLTFSVIVLTDMSL